MLDAGKRVFEPLRSKRVDSFVAKKHQGHLPDAGVRGLFMPWSADVEAHARVEHP